MNFYESYSKKEKLVHGFYSSTHPGSVKYLVVSVNLLSVRGANMPQIRPIFAFSPLADENLSSSEKTSPYLEMVTELGIAVSFWVLFFVLLP